MIKRLTENLGIKIFCLFAAVVLWMYVAAGQSTVGKFPGSIRIDAINVSSGLEAVYDVQTVDIKVMADSATWKKLSADSFTARVDMAARVQGTYEVPVLVLSTEAGVTIVEKTPDKIFVRLEPILTKEVSINKKLEGSVAEGLIASDVKFDVEKVKATGPKSLVNNLSEAIVYIKLNGESENFTKTLKLAYLNEAGEEVSGVTFDPPTVQASIVVSKAANNKTVGVKVITSNMPKTGYYVSAVTVTPSVIDVIGSETVLADVNYIETLPFDLTNISADVEKELSLNLANGIALQKGVSNKVRVKVKISEAEISREMTATIVNKNLYGNTVTAYTPTLIKVMVSGRKSLVDSLKSSDIVLNLDFGSKTITNSVRFDLKSINFDVPAGVSISEILPSSITATVQ